MRTSHKMRKLSLLSTIKLGIFIGMMTSCSSWGIIVQGGGGSYPEPGGSTTYESFESLGIPPGHLPPSGSCKVWYPHQPPGQQPPPSSCGEAFQNAPAGSLIISRHRDDPKVSTVNEVISQHPRNYKENIYVLKN